MVIVSWSGGRGQGGGGRGKGQSPKSWTRINAYILFYETLL